MKIVYYNPFISFEDGFVSKSIYEIKKDEKIKKLIEKGHRVVLFTLTPTVQRKIVNPNLFIFSIGKQTESSIYGDYFEEFVGKNPIDIIIFHREISISDEIKKNAKIVISDNSIDKIDRIFNLQTSDKKALYKYFVYSSDYYLAKMINEKYSLGFDDDAYYQNVGKDWWETEKEHDDWGKALIESGETHSMGKFEEQKRLLSRLCFTNVLDNLPPGSNVLDYGCQIGQITFYLAQKYTHLNFTGVDISNVQIEFGKKSLSDPIININKNVELMQCCSPSELIQQYDAVVCMEVLEHLWEFDGFLVELENACYEGGLILLTTPHGFYEGLSFPIFKKGERQHFHNFEEQDIVELIGNKKNFSLSYVSNDQSLLGDKNGHYGWLWMKDRNIKFGKINYQRKELEQNPTLNHEYSFLNDFLKNINRNNRKWKF